MAGLFTTLRNSTYLQLGKMVTSGAVSEAALRNFYRTEKRKAQNRISKLRNKKVIAEYGEQDLPKFMKEKNLTTMSALLHEIADLNRFLNKRTSLISGLKHEKQYRMEYLQNEGIDVTDDNYLLWDEFIKWFNLSEYSKKFEYVDEAVGEVFEEAMKNEKSSPKDWEKLFEKYAENENHRSKRSKYR